MCERITFPVKVCESCVIHGELKLLERARRTASFSLGPRDKPKHLRRGEVCFLWETPLPPNCFCFSGSDVSCNYLGMRVCVTAVLLVPQQRRSFRLFARFFSFFFSFSFSDSRGGKRTNVMYLRVKSSCCFMNLVWLCGTFRVAPRSVETRSVSSCWIPAHLVLWEPWNIKKAVCDLTIEPGQTFTRNPEKSRSGPPWL